MPIINKPQRNRGSTGGGFTLIELLVVIGIIALLSAIILASLKTARQRGQEAAILEEQHNVQLAFELYASSHNGGYPNPNRGAGVPGYYCIGGTTCLLASGAQATRLDSVDSGFKFNNFLTPIIPDAVGNQYEGFIYQSCGGNGATCPAGSSTLEVPLFECITTQHVGIWEKPTCNVAE